MPIREVRSGEFRSVAEAVAAAFFDEELWGDVMHPHRRKYPDDFVRFFEYRIWLHSFDRKRQLLVVTDPATGRIVGFGDWERQGKGGEKLEYGLFDPRRLQQPLAVLYSRIAFWFRPDRAADPSKLNLLEEAFPLIQHYWEGPRQENWYLDILAVHPEYQGYKYGRALVEWGLEQAAKENVVSSLVSADGKEGFYGKLGFEEVGRANVGPLAENGIRGGAIMFTPPKKIHELE